MHFKEIQSRCGGVCSSIMSVRSSFGVFVWDTMELGKQSCCITDNIVHCSVVFFIRISPPPRLTEKINIFIFFWRSFFLLLVGWCSIELLWCFHVVCLKWSTWIRFFHLSLQNMKLFWIFQKLIFFVGFLWEKKYTKTCLYRLAWLLFVSGYNLVSKSILKDFFVYIKNILSYIFITN